MLSDNRKAYLSRLYRFNYGLGIAQLRTWHCTITDFILRDYGLGIAQLRTWYCRNFEITDINHCKTIISVIIQKGGILWLFVEVN